MLMRLFDGMNVKDVLAWTTRVLGCAQRGDIEVARELFDLVLNKNSVARVDGFDFRGGLRLPESITGGDGIFPDQEHNACLLDHLGEVRPSDKLMGPT
ncbi:hypothetical protein OIU77_020893 [Salix suchowensis]|uniref:Pentatricopeptide repeat-containing protein n=1 Tax=Salix suchowensis TaxID=1278906 RepID=A0ABQ9CB41_9ROSI|nr:hypothetical protein OIU77_020893 [Salix suchowensis]